MTDADTGTQKRILRKKLIKKGISVAFSGGRLSALLFINPASSDLEEGEAKALWRTIAAFLKTWSGERR